MRRKGAVARWKHFLNTSDELALPPLSTFPEDRS
jgi:hypothetical protein